MTDKIYFIIIMLYYSAAYSQTYDTINIVKYSGYHGEILKGSFHERDLFPERFAGKKLQTGDNFLRTPQFIR